jgi:hypothetical protein
MNDEDLRAMIRESIEGRRGGAETADRLHGRLSPPPHASHGLFPLARGGDDDGACIIEPSVRCTHCGYCVSYGH